MADNVTLNAGSGGDTIAADDVGPGVKHQLVKIEYGTDGVATMVNGSNPLPVDVSDSATRDLGKVDIAAFDVELPAGTQNIGDVDVATIAAGDNNIGNVDIVTTPQDNVVSTNNSTTSTLGISGVYTGTGDDVAAYASVSVMLDASHDSATDGMTFQFSTDNTNWDDTYPFTYTAADGARRFQFPVTGQYFRIVYTNGGTGQTHFRVQTILHGQSIQSTIHRMSSNVDPDRSAQLVKSCILAQQVGTGDFIPVQSTAAGNFKIAIEEYDGVPAGGGVESGALRVTLANDSTGLLSVDDNGGNLSIDLGGTAATLNTGAVDAGTQRVTLATDVALPAGTNNIGDVDIVTMPNVTLATGTNTNEVVGDVAHDAPVAGNPVLIAGEARTTNGTAVGDGDAVRLMCDDQGRVITSPHSPRDLVNIQQTNLPNTTETTIVTAAASTFHDLVGLTVHNGAAALNQVTIRDSTAGTTRFVLQLAADGGGTVLTPCVPIPQATVNNNWTAQASVSGDVDITAIYIKRT